MYNVCLVYGLQLKNGRNYANIPNTTTTTTTTTRDGPKTFSGETETTSETLSAETGDVQHQANWVFVMGKEKCGVKRCPLPVRARHKKALKLVLGSELGLPLHNV